jgi:hypothetical protein
MLHFCSVLTTRRGFLASIGAALAALVAAAPKAQAAPRPEPRPAIKKTRWIGHY